MPLGKRRQPHRWTTTPIGRLQPAQGLQPRHADAALRLERDGRFDHSWAGARPSIRARTARQVGGAVKLLIGCARRAGMGSIRAVADAVRLVLRRAPADEEELATLAPAAIEAAAASTDVLSIDRREAAAAAGLAVLEATREADLDDPAAVRSEVVDVIRRMPPAPARPTEEPAVARHSDAVAELIEATVGAGHAPFRALREVVPPYLKTRVHHGDDITSLCRGIVAGVTRAAEQLRVTPRAAAALAKHQALEGAGPLGRHVLNAVHAALADWNPPECADVEPETVGSAAAM